MGSSGDGGRIVGFCISSSLPCWKTEQGLSITLCERVWRSLLALGFIFIFSCTFAVYNFGESRVGEKVSLGSADFCSSEPHPTCFFCK